MKNKKPWPDNFEQIVKDSIKVSQVLRKCNINPIGNEYKRFYSECQARNIDYSHFDFGPVPSDKIYANHEIFIENSPAHYRTAKTRIIRDNLLPNKCSECGIDPVWNNKKLVLIMDHINGVNTDHRLENLRFLCPNCNSQTDTFTGKNAKKYVITQKQSCLQCGKELKNKNSSGHCIKCFQKSRKKPKSHLPHKTKIVWPSIKTLKKELETKPFTVLARELGVSDNAIRKHIRNNPE